MAGNVSYMEMEAYVEAYVQTQNTRIEERMGGIMQTSISQQNNAIEKATGGVMQIYKDALQAFGDQNKRVEELIYNNNEKFSAHEQVIVDTRAKIEENCEKAEATAIKMNMGLER